MSNPHRDIKRFLFVEDHEDNWELVAFIFPEYKISCARNFDEGLRLARQLYFDFYILDNWLPDRSGVELCRCIRDFDPHTPILFYSAAALTHNIQEALSAGAQAYLIKPVSYAELKQTVARLISVVDKTAFEARTAEITAIREELAIQRIVNAERMEKAIEKRLRSEKKALKLKAEMAFLAAGGTRGDFARRWPSVFIEEASRRRVPDNEGPRYR